MNMAGCEDGTGCIDGVTMRHGSAFNVDNFPRQAQLPASGDMRGCSDGGVGASDAGAAVKRWADVVPVNPMWASALPLPILRQPAVATLLADDVPETRKG